MTSLIDNGSSRPLPERAILVHQSFAGRVLASDFDELEGLAVSAGAEVSGRVGATRRTADSGTFVGRGKAHEIAELVASSGADLVIVNQAITPIQERNLERTIGCRVVDRTRLILDIFAIRARTSEGKLQVELAQLQHLSTRLVRGWTHLERQRGGIGLRGPGETQLESDRRLLGMRIRHLQRRIARVASQRDLRRQRRRKEGIPTVAIVGYTNAGKSSLFNTLVGEHAYTADQLFATLDPTMRRLDVPDFGSVILSDTVGFIAGLPHPLVEAFMSTLEEVATANLLLHVSDDSNPDVRDQEAEVERVLEGIGAADIPRLTVRNKIDVSGRVSGFISSNGSGPNGVRVCASNGAGMAQLLQSMSGILGRNRIFRTIRIPASQGRLRARAYALAEVIAETVDSNGTWRMQISADLATIGQIEGEPGFERRYWVDTPANHFKQGALGIGVMNTVNAKPVVKSTTG
ncbi:GTPase HflX [Gammaproteobacteria bacterium]|nr:GTPase HflX [Gammaproteobacteria bacterium]